MALKLTTEYKGLTAEYWKILKADHDFSSGKVVVRLALYKDQTTRNADINNFIDIKAFVFDNGDTIREDLYAKIKESKIVDEVETNPFVNAEDC